MKRTMLVAAVTLAVLHGGPAAALDLGLSPATITMKVARGESAATTVAGTVVVPSGSVLMTTLGLRHAGGSMPASWLTPQRSIFINHPMPLLLNLGVKVPATAVPGTYTAHLQADVVNTNLPLIQRTPPVLLFVNVPGTCAGAPTVTLSPTQPTELWPPNGRLADVAIAGRITFPEGCTALRSWYTLTDEYGLYDGSGEVTRAADGTFAFSLPVQVSRRGDDRDGRTYRLTVSAQDEVGTASSAPAAVVVPHDQRKAK